jgi:hypothetical protein
MIEGPFDHQDTLYFFGDPYGRSSNSYWKTSATSLERAIHRFQIGGLYPYRYVKEEFRVMKEYPDDGHYHDKKIIGAKPGATIPVYAKIKDSDTPTHVYDLPFEVTMEDTTRLYTLPTNLLEGENSTALQTTTPDRSLDRCKVESELESIEDKIKDLESLKRDLQQRALALQKEVDEKLKQIWVIELYIGSHETIMQLSDGVAADVSEPITVFQQILCMDEEIAFYDWSKRLQREFDFNDITDFDNWLLESPEHLNQVIPAKKGIVGLRPRRKDKDYGGDDFLSKWHSSKLNVHNKKTYILIRNGERLYRIWADTQLWPRFFPLREEFDIKDKEHQWPGDEEKRKQKVEEYLRGLIVIQGLLDRSNVFAPLPGPINVMKPEDVEQYFLLVRNDEPALTDGANLPGWEEYKKWLHDQVQVGSRVILLRTCTKREDQRYYLSYKYWDGHYMHSFYPRVGDIFVIDRAEKDGRAFSVSWSFLYLPRDSTWNKWDGERARVHRVRWHCYDSEVVALDAISPRYVEYLLGNRYERMKYSEYFHLFLSWADTKREEETEELPFIELVLSQAGVNPRDPQNEQELLRVKRLVRWWKLKTKYTRTLSSDEPKALRMIKAAYLAGKDFDDDPEQRLDKERGQS